MTAEPEKVVLPAYTDVFPVNPKHPNALFEDNWSRVEDGEITLKCYFFPTGKNKSIDLKSIKGIYYKKQTFVGQCCKVKQWGQAFSPCWWACDKRRNWHGGDVPYFNVVLDIGESTYKGFTCLEIDRFLTIMKNNCHPDIVVKNELPF